MGIYALLSNSFNHYSSPPPYKDTELAAAPLLIRRGEQSSGKFIIKNPPLNKRGKRFSGL